MSPPSPRQQSLTLSPSAGTETLVALAGLACLVLPHHLLPAAMVNPPYGHPLIPWFASALANPRFLPTLLPLLALGIYLALAVPALVGGIVGSVIRSMVRRRGSQSPA